MTGDTRCMQFDECVFAVASADGDRKRGEKEKKDQYSICTTAEGLRRRRRRKRRRSTDRSFSPFALIRSPRSFSRMRGRRVPSLLPRLTGQVFPPLISGKHPQERGKERMLLLLLLCLLRESDPFATHPQWGRGKRGTFKPACFDTCINRGRERMGGKMVCFLHLLHF